MVGAFSAGYKAHGFCIVRQLGFHRLGGPAAPIAHHINDAERTGTVHPINAMHQTVAEVIPCDIGAAKSTGIGKAAGDPVDYLVGNLAWRLWPPMYAATAPKSRRIDRHQPVPSWQLETSEPVRRYWLACEPGSPFHAG